MKKIFINFSNHPSKGWSIPQVEAVNSMSNGNEDVEIQDVQFPNVAPFFDETEIEVMASKIAEKIASTNPLGVLCQGEFSLAFAVTSELKKHGINVFVACSERKSSEKIGEDGETIKTSVFEFVRFREI